MALQAPFKMTITGNKDVVDIQRGIIVAGPMGQGKGLTPYPVSPGGVYSLTYTSNIHYAGNNLLLNKCIIYNTTDNNTYGWFYELEAGGAPLVIQIGTQGTMNGFLFAFVVDITSGDNTGTGTVTVTQIA